MFYVCYAMYFIFVSVCYCLLSMFCPLSKKVYTYTRICKTKPKVGLVCRFSRIVGNFQPTSYDTIVKGQNKTFIARYSLTFFTMGKLNLNFSINLYLFLSVYNDVVSKCQIGHF